MRVWGGKRGEIKKRSTAGRDLKEGYVARAWGRRCEHVRLDLRRQKYASESAARAYRFALLPLSLPRRPPPLSRFALRRRGSLSERFRFPSSPSCCMPYPTAAIFVPPRDGRNGDPTTARSWMDATTSVLAHSRVHPPRFRPGSVHPCC